MEEEQRKTMFDAWKRTQKLVEDSCNTATTKEHRWSYTEPKHCLDCGKVKLTSKQ